MSMDDYAHGEKYLRTRFMFRDDNETEKAVSALRASRGAIPIDAALFAILEGASLLSDEERRSGSPGLWSSLLNQAHRN